MATAQNPMVRVPKTLNTCNTSCRLRAADIPPPATKPVLPVTLTLSSVTVPVPVPDNPPPTRAVFLVNSELASNTYAHPRYKHGLSRNVRDSTPPLSIESIPHRELRFYQRLHRQSACLVEYKHNVNVATCMACACACTRRSCLAR